ncbi:MAG: hypothetical protein ABJA71_12630 [Ginsengibacter sp.]
MKKNYIVGIILSTLMAGATPSDQFPQAEISNGIIHATLYLPDVKDGYYRASRFDWSGVMPELEYQGHTYFGQWFEKYDPLLHDAIMGPVEDFSPVGYDEAKAGDSFLKIGIGIVTKPDETRYSIATPYQLINPGIWKVKKKATSAEFIHTLNDKAYSYEYSKKVQLLKGKPAMVLSHILKNTGKQTIETNVYDHNFFVVDKRPVGKDFVIKFPFNLTGEARDKEEFGKIEDNQIKFLKNLSENEHLYYPALQGFGNSAKDYDIRIENHKTGAAVRITSDQPLLKLAFWSAEKTLSPEPFIGVTVKPGETFKWNISYQFYICGITN